MVHLLHEFSQMLSIDKSYEQALNRLGTILGGTFSVDTAENIHSEIGKEDAAMVAAFETAKKSPGNRRVATVAMAWIIRQVNARRRNGLVYLRNMIRSERHSLASDFCVSCEAMYGV
jgi:hypothetical protein